MTPMIDIVFQIIIFFICTIEIDKSIIDEKVNHAWARDAAAVEEQIPGTVTINVRANGTVNIGGTLMDINTFQGIMRTTAARLGNNFPVVIHGDLRTSHEYIKLVMDVCKGIGIWRVSFAALKFEG